MITFFLVSVFSFFRLNVIINAFYGCYYKIFHRKNFFVLISSVYRKKLSKFIAKFDVKRILRKF